MYQRESFYGRTRGGALRILFFIFESAKEGAKNEVKDVEHSGKTY